MIIPINLNTASASSSSRALPPQLAQFGTDEVVLIELQGALEVEGDSKGESVGTLRIDEATKKSTLLIGHHLLEGKLANLPKPLAILQRSTSNSERPVDASMDDDKAMHEESEDGAKSAQVEWNIVAVVKRKMVFSRRPMPMVGKISTSLSDSKSGKRVK